MKKSVDMLTPETLYREYVEKERSTTSIAEEYGTNPKRISRLLKKNGIKTRTRSQAQKLVVKEIHPTKGKQRTEEEKAAISKGGAASWSKERRQKASQVAKKLWDKKSPEEKEKMQQKAAKALYVSSKEGSKMEKHFLSYLSKQGYNVLHHEMVLPDESLEVDLWLTNKNIVVEIDGIRHIKPLHGEEDFRRRQRADDRKNSLLTTSGFAVIRIVIAKKNISENDLRNLEEKLVEMINKAKPGKVHRWIYE